LVLVVVGVTLAAGVAAAETLTIAAAADLNPVLNEIGSRFQKQTGNEVRVSYGASGTLVAQIQNGAPYDAFLSADVAYAQKLVQSGAATPDSMTVYGKGMLVVWSQNTTSQGQRWSDLLLSSSVKRIAMANPEHAPWGREAVSALRAANIYDQVRAKLVFGENVSQAAEFARSANADVALIPLSAALSPAMRERGHYLETGAMHEQAGVVLSRSRHKPLAQQFFTFLKSPEVRGIFREHGLASSAGK
jgi:molybdate transport system substrate-binding protein